MGVSVVMPVYNTKKEYICKAIESVQSQTYTDWELIIVDDGSHQDCAAFLDGFAAPSIKVVHQPNGGVSSARNHGIRLSTKEWIAFLDPDDWMDERQLETLVRTAAEEDADSICVNAYIVRGDNIKPGMAHSENQMVLEDENIWDLLMDVICRGRNKKICGKTFGVFLPVPWAKLYKRNILLNKEISFPEKIHPYEDSLFNLYYWSVCKKVILLNEYLHYYNINEGSVTIQYRDTWLDNNEKAMKRMNAFLESFFPTADYQKERNALALTLMCQIFHLQVFHPQSPLSYREKVQSIKKIILNNADFCAALNDIANPFYSRRRRLVAIAYRLRCFWLIGIFGAVHWRKSL